MDVLFLLETDIEGHKSDCNVNIPGYQVHAKWVTRDYGGIKNNKVCRIVSLIRTESFVSAERLLDSEGERSEIWLRLKCARRGGEHLTVVGVYNEWTDIEGTIRPGPDMESLKQRLAEKSNTGLLVTGDWNLRIDDILGEKKDYTHYNVGDDFHDHILKYGLDVHSVGKTFYAERENKNGRKIFTYTSLDWVITNLPTVYTRKKWLPFNTDHALIYADISVRQVDRKEYELRRNTRGLYSEECLAYLDSVDWTEYYGDDKQVDELAEKLQQELDYVMQTFSPVQLVRKRSTCIQPPTGHRAKKNKVNYLLRMGRVEEARRLQRDLTKERRRLSLRKVQKDLQQGNEDIFSLYKRFTRKEWQSTGVRDKRGVVRGGRDAAEVFAENFQTKLRNLKRRVKVDTASMNLEPWKNTFRFVPVNFGKVKKVIKSMKPSTSEDIYGLPQKALKSWAKSDKGIANAIWCIINRSFASGTFPSAWKKAKLTFLYKGSGDRLDASNYRPLSMLHPAGKALEVCATIQLTKFLEVNHLLPASQHGFRKGRSTVTAITDMLNWTDEQKRDGKRRALIAFDFSSAFDMVSHVVLNRKLEHLGADSTCRSWFTSFMSNRVMAVSVEGEMSNTFELDTCAPQGSSLSPILYLACCCDIGRYLDRDDNCSSMMYADDTSIAIAHKDPERVVELMEKACENMSEYSSQNGLALNLKKTVWMAMDNLRSDSIRADDKEIKEAKQMRLLGFHLSKEWSGATHLSSIKRKILYRISVIRRLSKYLPTGVLLSCVRSYVIPILEYGLEIWTDCTNPQRLHVIKSAEVLVKDAARASLGLRRAEKTPSSTLWEKLGVPTTRLRAVEKTLMAGYDLFVEREARRGRNGKKVNTSGRWTWLNKSRNFFVADRSRRAATENSNFTAQCIVGGESLRNKARKAWGQMVEVIGREKEIESKQDLKKKLREGPLLQTVLDRLQEPNVRR